MVRTIIHMPEGNGQQLGDTVSQHGKGGDSNFTWLP